VIAARRLIVFMLALLLISSIAAALVPVERSRESEPPTTPTAPAGDRPRGELVHQTIAADARKPAKIDIRIGDQLVLTVNSRRPDEVEIAGLGELRDVDRDAPARFDLLPFEPGTYPVRMLEVGRTVARIEVAPYRDGESSDSDSPGSRTATSTSGARSAS
jgi:hypothetical protein